MKNTAQPEKEKSAKKCKLDLEAVTCWVDHAMGVPLEVTAKRLGCCIETVWRKRKRLESEIDIAVTGDTLREQLMRLYPLALESVTSNLMANKELTTLAYLKGMGAYTDKSEISGTLKIEDADAIRQASIDRAVEKAKGKA